MAGNNIHGKEQVEEITRVWQQLTKEISNTVNVLEQYQKTTTKLPSEYLNSLKQVQQVQQGYNKAASQAIKTQTAYTASQKEEERIKKATARTTAQLNKELSGETKEYHKLNEELKKTRRERRQEARDLAYATSLYNKVDAKLRKTSQEYKELAVKKELNLKLTDKELQRLGVLEKRLVRYDTMLKKVDATTGKHTRNVGNYASGFDGLGHSINQLTREAPAFANSMQTGFMAISNNLPMLFDEISRLRTQNKALAADGKKTSSVLSQIGKSIFSWQTALSIGVTLLTIYGKELFEMAFGASEAEKQQTKLNDAIGEANASAISATNEYVALKNIINDRNQSEKVRAEALDELIEKIPELNGVTLDQADALEKVNSLTDVYIKAAFARAKADAFASIWAENQAELLKRKQKSLKDEVKWTDYLTSNILTLNGVQNKALVRRAKELGTLQQLSDTYEDEYIKALAEALDLESGLEGIASKSNKTRTEQITVIKGSITYYEQLISNLQKQQKETSLTTKQWNNYQEQIDNAKQSLQDLIIEFKGLSTVVKSELAELNGGSFDIPDIGAEIQEKLNSKTEYGGITFSDEEMALLESQFNRLGELYGIDASKFTALFDDKENTVSDYVAATGQAMQGLYNLFQNNYENDLFEFERNAQLQLQFTEEGTAARAEMERQLEQKRREIRNRQLKEERDAALFSAVVNTATAVTSALAEGGVVLAAIVGALGAAEILTIASTDIPQFKDGVRDFSGGLAVVGDGGVSEIIKTPDGKTFKTPNKDTLVNLPKGTNVYKSETDFNNELNNLLNFNGILPESKFLPEFVVNNNGLSKEDIAPFFNSLENSINNKKAFEFIWDENGIRKNIIKGTTKTNIRNNRVRGVGKGV